MRQISKIPTTSILRCDKRIGCGGLIDWPMRGLKTEPPPTKVEGFSGLERLRRTVEIFSD
jgi:hypothetical protein